jgi:hypothetical protein
MLTFVGFANVLLTAFSLATFGRNRDGQECPCSASEIVTMQRSARRKLTLNLQAFR